MNKFRPVLAIVAVLVMIAAVSVTASGGRVGKQKDLEAQLGARFSTPLAKDIREGQTIEAVVVNVGKLAKFGITGLKRGDKVRLIKGAGEADFVVEVVRRVSLTINAKGVVQKVGQ